MVCLVQKLEVGFVDLTHSSTITAPAYTPKVMATRRHTLMRLFFTGWLARPRAMPVPSTDRRHNRRFTPHGPHSSSVLACGGVRVTWTTATAT